MTHPNKQLQPIDDLVAEIEKLLKRRQDETKEGRDRRKPEPAGESTESIESWTWEELYYKYGSIRDMRRGKLKRPPPRVDVEYIADLLLCTLEERNELLMAARYAPHAPYIEGQMLKSALETARRIVDTMQAPAFVITRDYNMHYWNKYALIPFNATQEEEDKKRPLPEDRNILRYIFDPETPVYKVFNNYGNDSEWHIYTRELNIWRFKQDNVLCQYDKWYHDRVDSLMGYKDFKQTWDNIQIDSGIELISQRMPLGMVAPEYVTNIYRPDGREFRIRGLQIDYTGWGYPRIMVYTYDDENGRQIFEELGIPTSANGYRYL